MFEPEEIRRIEETLAAASDGRHGLAYAFYEELFDALPEARQVFDGDLDNHVPRFMDMLQAIPLAIEMPDEMRETLRAIGVDHYRIGVRDWHYDAMIHAVMRALARVAGRSWNPAAAEAWRRFLDFARAEIQTGWAEAATRRNEARA